MTPGAIAGIVIGALVVLSVFGVVGFLLVRRHMARKKYLRDAKQRAPPELLYHGQSLKCLSVLGVGEKDGIVHQPKVMVASSPKSPSIRHEMPTPISAKDEQKTL